MVSRPGRYGSLLRRLLREVTQLSKHAKPPQSRTSAKTYRLHIHRMQERRCAMSAALTLPQIWATSNPVEQTRPMRLRPIEGFAFYRKHTEALLRRYMQISMEMGRTPSLLGNYVFRGKVSSYRIHTFEDNVIFLFDVEKCLKRLDSSAQELIARITLQDYTYSETAELTNQSMRSIIRKYGETL